MSAGRLTQAASQLVALQAELEAEKAHTAERQKLLSAEIKARFEILRTAEAGLDHEKIELAETFMFATDPRKGGAEVGSAIADARRQIATGVPRNHWCDLRKHYIGTKNYAHWYGQRCDCPYGSGPKHGHIAFRIEFRPEARDRDLTPEEREAGVYYLSRLVAIHEARADAAIRAREATS